MGTKRKDDSTVKVPVRTNGTRTGWGTDTGGSADPKPESPIPIVRIDRAILRSAVPGAMVTLSLSDDRIAVLVGGHILGEVSGQHERRIRIRNATSGMLAEIQQDPPKATFQPKL